MINKIPRREKPNVRIWIYPGSRTSYKTLLSLKAYTDPLSRADAINFKVNYLFPWKYYEDNSNPTAPKANAEDCYSMDTYCSIGLVDCMIMLTT